jgi:uncharacterized membrane protein
LRWFAYAHPAWMVVGITLAFMAMRAGLKLRRARTQAGKRTRAMRDAHLRLAKPAVVVVSIGFLGGVASAYFLRGWTPFENFHGWLGLGVVGLFVAAAVVGHRVEEGKSRAFDTHAMLGGLALLAAAIAAAAGFALLP